MDIKELKFQVWRLSEMEKKYQIEIQQLKDKLHRRNMQIKDLKADNLNLHQANSKIGSTITSIYAIVNNEKLHDEIVRGKIACIING